MRWLSIWRLVGVNVVSIASLMMSATVINAETFSADETKAFAELMGTKHNFDPADIQTLLGKAEVLDAVLEAISRPAESKAWHEYREIFIKPIRIERGADFYAEHRETLERAEKQYGVPPEIIVAIIGVETLYGEHTGRYRVLDSLATLGFRYPRRAKFFSSELEHFLLLAREESLDPLAVTGSYAGAMGIPQFISSSYRSYAVDFDDDEVRNLLGSVEDAIGSVSNYLKRHGWRRGEPIAVPTRVEGDSHRVLLERGLKPETTIAEIKRNGVSVYQPVADDKMGALLEFGLRDGVEYWIGLDNFYAITRYNHSALYAMAVFQLSQAILETYQNSP